MSVFILVKYIKAAIFYIIFSGHTLIDELITIDAKKGPTDGKP